MRLGAAAISDIYFLQDLDSYAETLGGPKVFATLEGSGEYL